MENITDSPANKKSRKSKVQKNWQDEDIFKLISLVEGESCIWNASVEGYHNKTMRDVAWGKISEHFGTRYDTADLNAKWTNLRIQFRSYASRSKTKSGQGVVEPVKWKFFNAMHFVGRAEDRQTQQTTSNLVLETESDSSSHDCTLKATPRLPSPRQAATVSSRRYETSPSVSTLIAESMREAVAAIKERNQNAMDPNISFANYLVCELKALSQDAATNVRKKVTKFFLQCLEEQN